ncbi:flagellar hook-length control protein FliK [Luteibacter rhizovicinus]|uniref:Flagellar hook-length control protein FliK n=1 Tax=Luteibacter rhizovicinus TaxID=242606 RepID=A0A4R3YNV0_9GAMM|nr:flagellar hook-length control protein FliK [Luteibacter rhizovicinus]TCV94030.1 flagellar hook-length control protein FliK [Luteibacter rhizovicinus]
MNIPPTTSLAAQLWAGAAAGTAGSVDSWRVGTLLSANLLGLSDQGRLLLQVGGMTVEADAAGTQLPQQFQVRVLTQGAQPQLEILAQPAGDRIAMQGLRDRLPLQNGYAPLLGVLSALARRPAARLLPAPLRTALATLEAAISKPGDVGSPSGLKEAIARSGLFLESRLSTPADEAPATDDWKAALLQLRRTLDELPPARARSGLPPSLSDTAPPLRQRPLIAQMRLPEMSTETEVEDLVAQLRVNVRSALARVEIAQLESPPQTGVWMVEIPLGGVRGYDILQLRIEESAPRPEDREGAWTVGFAVDLPSLGAIQGEIQLRTTRVSVRIWAQHGPTVSRIEDEFLTLRQLLERSGLQLDHLSCIHGLPQPAGAYSAVLLEATA